MEDKREFIYCVDSNDRVVFANANWYAFACENDASALNADAVVGRVLWDFIGNAETRHLFKILLEKIRRTGVPVTLPFRCDAPGRRRFMESQLVPQPSQEVEFRSRILRQEPREWVRLLDGQAERTGELMVMCGWCKKVALPGRRWVEVEEAVSELRLFNEVRLPQISHGMCEECSRAFLKDL